MEVRFLAALIVCAVVACPQDTEKLPSFEAASVKPSAPGQVWRVTGGPGTNNPGQFTATNTPLKNIILFAFDLPGDAPNLASGLPPDRERYNIVAKIPAGATQEQFRLMLRSLLVERFGLAFHWEARTLPAYDLVVAKGGPKLRDAEMPPIAPAAQQSAENQPMAFGFPADKDGWPILPPGKPFIQLYGRPGTPMAHLAARMQPVKGNFIRILQEVLGRPVNDQTGLTGTYDFTLDFDSSTVAAYIPAPGQSDGQSSTPDALRDPAVDLFAAIEKQLGLRLVSIKSSTNVLVIDKVSDHPTEN